jgi:hypothetical protein
LSNIESNLSPVVFQLTVYGYELVQWRLLAVHLFMLLTAGLFWLLLYWVPKWKLLLSHKKVPLQRATSVLIEVKHDTCLEGFASLHVSDSAYALL